MTPTAQTESSSAARPAGERAIVAALMQLAASPKDDWEQAIQRILQVESEVLAVERVSYWCLREDPKLLECDMGYIAGPRAFERGAVLFASQHPRYFAEIARRGVVDVEDAQNDPRTADLRDYLRVRHISSLLDVPVWSRCAPIGVLCHEHTGPIRRWSDSDVDFAMAIAATVAATLEAQARSSAEEARRKAAFLDQTALQLTRTRDPRAVAQLAAEIAVGELANGAVLDVLEQGEFVRRVVAHRTAEGRALLDEMARRHTPRAHGVHPIAAVVRLQQSVLVPDLARGRIALAGMEAGELELFERLGVHSAMAIPLIIGERVLGVMQFHAAGRQFDQGELRFAEDFVEHVAAALDNAYLHQTAEAAIRCRDEFIALAAHELHGPLTSLQLSAESLASSIVTTPETTASMGKTVVRQIERLNRLVDHMLDTSRIMTKRFALSPSHTDLSKLVQEIASNFRERTDRSGSALHLHVEPDIVGCWDADRLAQVVSNLLDNAVKFGAGKPIEVSLRSEDGQAELRVSDHGIGIAPDRVASVFDPFVRAVPPRSFGGLGLGLFMSKAIVDAHGGQIAVSSRPGQGSTFTVRLKRDGVALEPDAGGAAP